MIIYRAEIVIWMLTGILPLVMLSVWLPLAETSPVGDYTQGDFVAYYVVSLLVRQLVSVWFIWDLDREIRLGELSSRLLKPMDPIVHFLVSGLASKPLRGGVLLPVVMLAFVFYPDATVDLRPGNLLAFGLSLVGGFAIYFLTQYCIGLCAFWVSQAVALHNIWFNFWLVFSGYFVPLDLLPPVVARLSAWLPFAYTVFFPSQILLGRLTLDEIQWGLGVQMSWVVVLILVWRLLWWRGVRVYAAVGA